MSFLLRDESQISKNGSFTGPGWWSSLGKFLKEKRQGGQTYVFPAPRSQIPRGLRQERPGEGTQTSTFNAQNIVCGCQASSKNHILTRIWGSYQISHHFNDLDRFRNI